MGPLWLAERRGPSNKNKTRPPAAGEHRNSNRVIHQQDLRHMPQGSGQQWRQLSCFPSPAPWLSSRYTSVWWKAARRHSRSSTHFWSTSRATRRSWATAATSVARTFPHCMTWVCTSTPTASCHSTAPRRTALSTSMCPSTAFSYREPRGLQPWWFSWLRTSETP